MRPFLITSLVALSLLAPGSAQAAGCSWQSADLPLPAGTRSASISSGSPDGSWVAGSGTDEAGQKLAILWHDGVARSMKLAPGERTMGVNASGTLLISTIPMSTGRAYRGGVELDRLPGAGSAYASLINSSGTAVGHSGAALVTWPAGSQEARLLPGTDDGAGWLVAGIDDAGRVAATNTTSPAEPFRSYVWDELGTRTFLEPLPGHTDTNVRAIREGRVVGLSSNDVFQDAVGVEWDLRGNVIRTFDHITGAVDVTSSGDVLGAVSGGYYGVHRAATGFERLPWGVSYSVFADTGDLYGVRESGGSYHPVRTRCV